MKCPACGREMVNKVTHFDCPNILCDYEEEIEKDVLRLPVRLPKHEFPVMAQAVRKEVNTCS